VIILSRAQLETIERAAEAAYPAEACGLIVGKQNESGNLLVSKVIPSPNILANKRADRFEVDPQVRIDTERRVRGTDIALIGHYHTHPDHPAAPSETDQAMAFEPNLVWLITSVTDGKAADTRAFRLTGDQPVMEELELRVVK
jgi:proteasome lid subunit RPN8/RPN11